MFKCSLIWMHLKLERLLIIFVHSMSELVITEHPVIFLHSLFLCEHFADERKSKIKNSFGT